MKSDLRFDRKTLLGLTVLSVGFYVAMQSLESLEQSLLSPVTTTAAAPMPTQSLPIVAHIKLGNRTIELEVARSVSERAIGLMGRDALPADRGMLFVVEPPRNVRIWMQGMEIPLDIVFLREGVITAISSNVPPCEVQECPRYEAGVAVDHVLEIGAGEAAALGWKVGDRVDVILPGKL